MIIAKLHILFSYFSICIITFGNSINSVQHLLEGCSVIINFIELSTYPVPGCGPFVFASTYTLTALG